MEFLYFVVKYIPFWGIPIIFIFGPASYVYWLKDVKRVSLVFLLLVMVCFVLNVYWVWAGGPERSVEYLQDFIRKIPK